FSLEERVAIIRAETEHLHSVAEIDVQPYERLTLRFAREGGADVVVRGMRAKAHYETADQQTSKTQQPDREIETVFLMADPRHQAIASRLVKEIAQLGGDVTKFVSPRVRDALMAKVG